MRFRLSTRLTVAVIAVQILMLIALVWNSIRLINSSHATLFEEKIQEETTLLANSLAPGLAFNDRATLNDVLTLVRNQNNLTYLLVKNANGDTMAKWGAHKAKRIDSSFDEALSDGVYDIVREIELAGQHLGVMKAGYSTGVIEQFVAKTRQQNSIIASIGLLVSMLVTIIISVYLTRSLRQLEAGAVALKSGDLHYRVSVDSSDEIGDLGRSFNKLAEHLNNTEIALQKEHKALQRETRFLQTLLNGVDAVVVEAEPPNYKISYVSNEAANLLGYSTEQWLTPGFLLNHLHLDDKQWVAKVVEENSRSAGSFTVDFRMLHADGHMLWVRAINAVETSAEGRSVIRGLLLDITEQKNNEHRIIYLAEHDSLTGLINRRRFQEELERAVAYSQRYQQQGALFFIDLDQFKYINDTYGHQYGDEYLIDVSRRLSKVLRKTDVLGRLGGDEFGVIIPSADSDTTQTVARSLLAALSQESIEQRQRQNPVSASIGIVFFPTQAYVAGDLLAKADAAMYTAKNKGRSRFHLFSEDDDELWNMQAKIHWEERIRWALEHDKFVLHFQPVAALDNFTISHYEVLLRMQSEDGELIPPGAFLDTAERFGLIRDIDRWVLKHTIKEQARRRDSGQEVSLAVNISGRHFGSSEILQLVKRSMQEFGADPGKIIFEVTETAAVENLNEARNFIDSLKSIGCRFALDDFGIGFSSFHYLRNLPVDYVKIDGSFVRNLHMDQDDRIFVKAMVDLASGLGITCIAEFVENKDIVNILLELGVGLGQGYYLSKPAPDTYPDNVLKFIAA